MHSEYGVDRVPLLIDVHRAVHTCRWKPSRSRTLVSSITEDERFTRLVESCSSPMFRWPLVLLLVELLENSHKLGWEDELGVLRSSLERILASFDSYVKWTQRDTPLWDLVTLFVRFALACAHENAPSEAERDAFLLSFTRSHRLLQTFAAASGVDSTSPILESRVVAARLRLGDEELIKENSSPAEMLERFDWFGEAQAWRILQTP
jgi:hypothetical protein